MANGKSNRSEHDEVASVSKTSARAATYSPFATPYSPFATPYSLLTIPHSRPFHSQLPELP
jgi:hypothetical protein